MKIRVQKTGLYHYNLYAKRFIFFVQKIGTATISLDGKRINLNINPRWWGYARDIGEYIEKEYLLQQESKQGS